METEIKLKVGELTERGDFGRGIVRIAARDMKRIAINEGDVVEIEGKRKTAAIAVRAYPADVGLDIIRMDGLERRNCGAGIGEAVKIKKAEVKEKVEEKKKTKEEKAALWGEYVEKGIITEAVAEQLYILLGATPKEE